jgi:hypothetical protein
VAIHGRTRPHGDGAGPWVVEGQLGSVAFACGSSGGTHEAMIATASVTTTNNTRGGRGMRASEEHNRRCSGGHGCYPLEVAKAIAELEAASAPMVISTSRSLRTSWKQRNETTQLRKVLRWLYLMFIPQRMLRTRV